MYNVRRLLEVEPARLGAARIIAEDCDKMQAEYDLMRSATTEGRVVALLDHDEALLTILYNAAGNPVLLEMVRTLWSRCRGYKIVGAQGTLESPGDESLWNYQQGLIAAARNHDAAAAAAVNNESLVNATDRIRALLAAQSNAE